MPGTPERTNYVFIDYENVQPKALSTLDAAHFRVLVFIGANQAKVAFDAAFALQRMGERAQYIKIAGNGPNALDFHIAFHLGQLAAQDPHGYFHIVSKDTGFDPLVRHLRARKLLASRVADLADIPLLKAAGSRSAADRIDAVVANLRQRGTSRPRTIKTLTGTIKALFQNQLPEAELAGLLKALEREGHILVQDSKVSYALPGQAP